MIFILWVPYYSTALKFPEGHDMILAAFCNCFYFFQVFLKLWKSKTPMEHSGCSRENCLSKWLFLSMEIFPVASGRLAMNVNLGMCLTVTECIGVCAERDWVMTSFRSTCNLKCLYVFALNPKLNLVWKTENSMSVKFIAGYSCHFLGMGKHIKENFEGS